MTIELLDDFQELTGWSVATAGQARLRIRPDSGPNGPAMRLDFDVGAAGGCVVARKPMRLSLPDSFAWLARVKAEGPPSAIEFRLVEAFDGALWRLRDASAEFGADWSEWRVDTRALTLVSGPASRAAPGPIAAVEIAILPSTAGAGQLWLADLRLRDLTPSVSPHVRASGACPGEGPEHVLDADPSTCWRADRLPAWLELDFQEPSDYGGLILRWRTAEPRAFRVLVSESEDDWACVHTAARSVGDSSHLYLPGGHARRMRLLLDGPEDAPASALVALEVQSQSFSRSLAEFLHRLAEDHPRGRFPRWLYREQSYWTLVGTPSGGRVALFNEEGLIEPPGASYSIEPLLRVDGALLTWADCAQRQGLANSPLPMPEASWIGDDLALSVTAFALEAAGVAVLHLRYRLENQGAAVRSVALHVAARPFRVRPSWQGDPETCGVGRIRRLGYRQGALWVNGRLALRPLNPPSGFGAATFDEGSIVDWIAAGALPQAQEVMDPVGLASGALCFERRLAPGEAAEIECAVPLSELEDARAWLESELGGDAQSRLDAARASWSDALGGVDFRFQGIARDYADACRAVLAHLQAARDGAALQSGPGQGGRAQMREAVVMVAALLRLGVLREAADFIRWYAGFQSPDGHVPVAVDARGCDWRPGYDSQGQLIFAIAEYWRFSGDRDWLRALWPVVLKAVDYLEQARAERMTPYFQAPERRACHGLLPESVRGEGDLLYAAHRYWDDFWAVRGLKDALELAECLGDGPQAARLAVLLDEFRASLYVSLDRVMEERGIEHLPASVEEAEFDPVSTAGALTLVDEAHRLPPSALSQTLDRFMAEFRARLAAAGSVVWEPCHLSEMRVIGALVRLGRRDEAHELAAFYLDGRRPPVWGQWPETIWRDPRVALVQGELPQVWIGAEYVLAFRDCLVHEREQDRSLVVAAGVPAEWLDEGELAVEGLPTHYGALDLVLSRSRDEVVRVWLDGRVRIPPGGIQVAPPLSAPMTEVWVNGAPSKDFNASEVRVTALPAEIEIRA